VGLGQLRVRQLAPNHGPQKAQKAQNESPIFVFFVFFVAIPSAPFVHFVANFAVREFRVER